MDILLSGSTGMVGSALLPVLRKDGHEVIRLSRTKRNMPEKEVTYDIQEGSLEEGALDVDAVIHLAGENIVSGRWSESTKRAIRDSRVKSTELLADRVCDMESPPQTFICASAIGYYGDTGDTAVDEEGPPGDGFLADVCKEWEAATEPMKAKGIRVINLRVGVVISETGGALAKMLKPFKFGLGGVLGSGDQYMSWVSLEDIVGILHFALTNERLEGPVNAVAPHPVTNKEFTKTLGRVLNRPTLMGVPAAVLKAVMGEMAEEMLLVSSRVTPAKLREANYKFAYPDLEEALRHHLNA